MAEPSRTPPFLLEQHYVRTKVIRTATASERPSVGPGRARDIEPARIPLWPPGQHEVPTNDEPRRQPARPETRPNQRLYVPLGSPPLVAVGSFSARAAHRSRAPQTDNPRITQIAARVKNSRRDAGQKTAEGGQSKRPPAEAEGLGPSLCSSLRADGVTLRARGTAGTRARAVPVQGSPGNGAKSFGASR